MQNDASVRTLFNITVTMAWLFEETETKYPISTTFARKSVALPVVIFS
jgi:hypothetical protein